MAQSRKWERGTHSQKKSAIAPSLTTAVEHPTFTDEASRFLVETMDQGALCSDEQGRILMVNEAALTMLGMTREQLLGQTTIDPLGKALREDGTPCPAEAQPAALALQQGKPVRDIMLGCFNEYEQSYRWLLMSAIPQIRPGAQKPSRIFTLFSDFTPYAYVFDTLLRQVGLTEGDSKERLQEFEVIFETVFRCISIYDPQGHIKRLSFPLQRAFQLSAEEAGQQTLQSLSEQFQFEDEEGHVLALEQWPMMCMLRGEIQKNRVVSIRPKDQPEQHPVHITMSGLPIHDIQGAIVGGVMICIDVTDQRGAERCSQRALHALLTMAEAMVTEPQDTGTLIAQTTNVVQPLERFTEVERGLAQLPLGLLDCSCVAILLLNEETQLLSPAIVLSPASDLELLWRNRLEGASLHALLGGDEQIRRFYQGIPLEPATTLFYDQPSYKLVAPISRYQKLKGVLLIDYGAQEPLLSGEDDALILGVARLAALLVEREQAQYERDHAVAELQKSNVRLELTNRMKSNLVSIVSHEFRTSLTDIQGFSEILQRNELNLSEVREYATDIREDAQRLVSLINDMLDLDRLEMDHIQLHLNWLDLNALINEAVARMRRRTQKHTFRLQLARALPILWGDREKLMIVLINLLDNAIKYSPDGGAITVVSELEDLCVHISVSDQGVGIPPEELEHVFERYKRLPSGPETVEGRGLGLSIVREIILLHGGKVWVESAQGRGSIFHYTLRTAST